MAGMISFKQSGDFKKIDNYLGRLKKSISFKDLDKYGRQGVSALMSATPIDTGLLKQSWYYEITIEKGIAKITFCNSDIENGINVAILIQYGHATKNGGFVEGIDYINPAIRPIFEKIADEAWKEVTKE